MALRILEVMLDLSLGVMRYRSIMRCSGFHISREEELTKPRNWPIFHLVKRFSKLLTKPTGWDAGGGRDQLGPHDGACSS